MMERALPWIAGSLLVYAAIAVILFLNGEVTLTAIAIAPVYFALRRIRRPPSWRLQRALRALRRKFVERTPAIVQTRVMEWTRGEPTVYLLCAQESDAPALAAQQSVLRALIVTAAKAAGVDVVYLGNLRLWLMSKEQLDREGGWFAFDHNVPWPRPEDPAKERS